MPMNQAQYDLGVSVFLGLYFGIPALLLLIYMLRRIRVVEAGTAMVVERCGRFHRRCDAGLHFLVPFADRPREVVWRSTEVFSDRSAVRRWSGDDGGEQTVKIRQTRSAVVDLRESIMDFPSQPVITRDNVKISVHPMLLLRVVDPVRVAYEVYDLPQAIEKLVQTTLRSVIGEMGLDDTLSSREEIERSLKHKISKVALDWGVAVISIEILEITPTAEVQRAMHKQLSAERIRRAAIVSADGGREKTKLEAEGECQSAIALATGDKQVAIVRAQGQADARKLLARAEADAVRIIGTALAEYGVDATAYIIGLKYMESLVNLACSASSREVYVPLQMDVSGALAMVGEGATTGAASAGVGAGAGAVAAR